MKHNYKVGDWVVPVCDWLDWAEKMEPCLNKAYPILKIDPDSVEGFLYGIDGEGRDDKWWWPVRCLRKATKTEIRVAKLIMNVHNDQLTYQ